jgi:hypothetical protein
MKNRILQRGDSYPCRSRDKRRPVENPSVQSRVEAGSNNSTVALRVVGGEKKRSLESETVKYGRESHGTRTREWMRWRGLAAIVNDRPILSSGRMLYMDYDRRCSIEKTIWPWVSKSSTPRRSVNRQSLSNLDLDLNWPSVQSSVQKSDIISEVQKFRSEVRRSEVRSSEVRSEESRRQNTGLRNRVFSYVVKIV